MSTSAFSPTAVSTVTIRAGYAARNSSTIGSKSRCRWLPCPKNSGTRLISSQRSAAVLRNAEIVLYDALVTPDMLAHCPQAELVSVGKRSGQRSMAQTLINQPLLARQYRRPPD